MSAPIEPSLWREAMGGFPTGVTIVTTRQDGRPAGTVVNAFSAVSLQPALLLVCLDRDSRTLAALRDFGAFGVNILSSEQEGIVERFARKDATDRFAGLEWDEGASGAPRLLGGVASFDCRVHEIVAGGDHEIVLGHVVNVQSAPLAQPLLYCRSRVRALPHEATQYAARA